MTLAIQRTIPNGATWQDVTGRTWTANGDDLNLVFGEIEGVVKVYQVRF